MHHEFWATRWHQGHIGFHLDRPNPSLEKHWSTVAAQAGAVLVPLCGKSHDLDWLAARGHDVFGVEFVEHAVAAFFGERGLEPRRRRVGSADVYEQGPMHLIRADLFDVGADHVPACELVYDRAALVAIEPVKRRKYAEKLHSLTGPGSGLLLINFLHDMESGPPFSIPDSELRQIWDGLFELELLEERDVLRFEPRFAERGATQMLEQVWRGRRC